jgi:excisionase family DNA binding protein
MSPFEPVKSPALVRVGVAARYLGLHPMTVRRWIDAGKIHAVQIGREARIPMTEIERLLGEQPAGKVVLYARVSGHGQTADLERQVGELQGWAKRERAGREVEVISDMGSGLNAHRKGVQRVLKQAQERRLVEVAVTYRDRLSRFGVEYLEALFRTCSVRLTVLNDAEAVSAEEELTRDLVSLVVSFSGRLYGRRSHRTRELVECVKATVKS